MDVWEAKSEEIEPVACQHRGQERIPPEKPAGSDHQWRSEVSQQQVPEVLQQEGLKEEELSEDTVEPSERPGLLSFLLQQLPASPGEQLEPFWNVVHFVSSGVGSMLRELASGHRKCGFLLPEHCPAAAVPVAGM